MFTDDIASTYYAWNMTTSGKISELFENVAKIEVDHGNLGHRVESLSLTREALMNLTGVEDIIRTALQDINEIGIDLERNYEIALRNEAENFKTDAVFKLKDSGRILPKKHFSIFFS